MPDRVDLPRAGGDALDRLIALRALDVEALRDGGIAALMPDSVTAERVGQALGELVPTCSPRR